MALPTIVSYYTDSWKYPELGKQLRDSCKKLGLKHQIEMVPDRGSWSANTRFKPTYILDAVERNPNGVLWLDVDGRLSRAPVGIDPKADLMLCQREDPKLKWPYHVAVIYVAHTQAAMWAVTEWEWFCRTHPRRKEDGDDWCLELTRREGLLFPRAKISFLPKSLYYQRIGKGGPDAVYEIGLSQAKEKKKDPARFHSEYGK